MSRRVLLVGHGRIGREVFADYRETLIDHALMVVDPVVDAPAGYEWDGFTVDLAVIMVDTPAADSRMSGFDYRELRIAVEEYLAVAEFIVICSTVELGFLDLEVYRENSSRIGFSPEFHGATRHSSRDALSMDFVVFSDGVPAWFVNAVCADRRALRAPAAEVIVAKLAENAFLATKVTFFHELSLACRLTGVSFDVVREIVTNDPRITPYHSFADDGVGWSSHCFDKDVPTFVAFGRPHTRLVAAACRINADLLASREPLSFVLRE